MRGKIYRAIVAFVMLVLYITVMAASDFVAITCHCNSHSGDVHTAFNHRHQCQAEHCDHSHDAVTSDYSQQIANNRCCNHDHSNDIDLYLQPRTVDDDHSLRQAMLLSVVTDKLNHLGAQSAASGSAEYGEYLLPSLGEGHTSGGALRAPPALV